MEDIGMPRRHSGSLGHGKTRYTGLDPNNMARVRPRGSDGQEIPVNLVYDQVKVATKFSQQDCKLDNLLEGLEEEEVFESK